jgi:hypothetical protein
MKEKVSYTSQDKREERKCHKKWKIKGKSEK